MHSFLRKTLRFLRDYWAVTAIALIFAVIFGLFLAGWRLGPGGMPVRTGELIIEGVPQGTAAYLDQVRRQIAGPGGSVRMPSPPGSHTVIVDAPGYQPWNELFTVDSGAATHLRPILVPKEPTGRVLHAEERENGIAAILAYDFPERDAPLPMAGGCALVFVTGGLVVANATTTEDCAPPEYLLCPLEEGGPRTEPCPSSTVIFSGTDLIESVSPFPGRDDALIIAAGSSAYVVEIDPRAPQFFAPLMKGPRLRAAPWSDTAIVISDTKHVYELTLVQ